MEKFKSVISGVVAAAILVAGIGIFATFSLALIGLFAALIIPAALAVKALSLLSLLVQRNHPSGNIYSNNERQNKPIIVELVKTTAFE